MRFEKKIARMVGFDPAPRGESPSFSTMNRRDFLKVSLTAGGGLLICLNLPAKLTEVGETAPYFQPNPFLRINPDRTITVWVARSELGQGVRTSLPMIVAEELGANWSDIRVEQAEAHQKYGSMGTGGSHSVETSWLLLRNAGAMAREMLIDAAAATWNVERSSCRAVRSHVIHWESNRRAHYAELIEAVARIEPPEEVALKDPEEFSVIGWSKKRVDGPAIVDGSAVFGWDVKVPRMLYATIERCPVYGGELVRFDAAAAKAVPGVRDVITINPVGPGSSTPGGVAVIADSSWAAIRGKEALEVVWDEGENARWNTADIYHFFREKVNSEPVTLHSSGEPAGILKKSERMVEAVYETPYLAHVTMEPMNCTVDFRGDSCEVWAPTQFPRWAQYAVHQVTGLPMEAVRVHVTLSGGGFGRRINPDYAVEAAQVSMAVQAPVKVIWTREDDIRHDRFHLPSLQRLTAALDDKGYPTAWAHRIVEPNSGAFYDPDFSGKIDPEEQSIPYFPYDVPNVSLEYVHAHVGVPIGFWRSVDKHRYAFAMESFVDELAAAAGIDPLKYRMNLLRNEREIAYRGEDTVHTRRLFEVLKNAASLGRWDDPLPEGHARGIACYAYASCSSYAAEVAEVSITANGRLKVHRVSCAIDCGIAVNPDTILAQIEGSVVFGLSAVLHPPITIRDGRPEQSNFDDYEIPTIGDAPEVDVHIVRSGESPGGVGEPAVPPLAPAVANAVFALTGKRIRRLPILAGDLRG